MEYDKSISFYVSPMGCDKWSGMLPEPDGLGTDGPFATLEKAVEASRSYGSSMERKITVRGGSYFDTYIALKAEDSGITIQAMPGETPILYGGKKIMG